MLLSMCGVGKEITMYMIVIILEICEYCSFSVNETFNFEEQLYQEFILSSTWHRKNPNPKLQQQCQEQDRGGVCVGGCVSGLDTHQLRAWIWGHFRILTQNRAVVMLTSLTHSFL